jgi:SNF2 family DNA or RNA helicase
MITHHVCLFACLVFVVSSHVIRNHKSKTTLAVFALEADRRWFMSGTPIQNNLNDLYSAFKFLRFKPYDDMAVWKSVFAAKTGQGLARLRTILATILLRRTKTDKRADGSPLIVLPTKTVKMHTIGFNEKEQKFYDVLSKAYKERAHTFLK